MPSNRRRQKARSKSAQPRHAAFFPLLVLSFIFWLIYRGVFQFPIYFDEIVGKAIFFGLPVWLYVLVSGYQRISDTFAVYKIKRGLMLGIAVGGVLGFVTSLVLTWRGGEFYRSFAFLTDQFWWEFFLAIVTSFWETLFFFSFVMLVIQDTKRRWSFMTQLLFVMAVFLIFHLPNTFLRFQGVNVAYQVGLLALFALGQALLFARERNGYSLVLSQALWGMTLLLHF